MISFSGTSFVATLAVCAAFGAEERQAAWTPQETLASIQLDGPYEARLVAAEPLVRDPVEICWDERGACYVADMIDYPLGGPDGTHLSRIQRLFDDNGDGVYDRAVTFADNIDHAQGLLPHQGGLIVTTRTQVLFLKDNHGDGRADIRRPLIAGFNPSFSQLQVSSPRWGLDGEVYFNNGLDSKQIYPVADDGKEGAKTEVARHNLRWNPTTNTVVPTSGFGQFGASFDDWGRHFSSSNRSPVIFAVTPLGASGDDLPIPPLQPWENIAPHGPASRIFPLQVTHTTSDAHAGTNTSACGITVYRGDLMPELLGEIFVCDPTGQLVTRFRKPKPDGSSLRTNRIGERTEFFRSRDEWCRPVNLTTGPDGALYVCDIYRKFIDHARFFPDDFVKSHDMRLGEHHGRIWKIVPKGYRNKTIPPLNSGVGELISSLSHENAWQRETAHRRLREQAVTAEDKRIISGALAANDQVSSLGKLHKLWLHAGLGKGPPNPDWTADLSPELAENLVLIAHRHPGYFGEQTSELLAKASVLSPRARMLALSTTRPAPADLAATIRSLAEIANASDDTLLHHAILIHLNNHTGRFAAELLRTPYIGSPDAARTRFLTNLAASSAASGNKEDLEPLLSTLKEKPGELLWWKAALIEGLAQGLPKSGSKSLPDLSSEIPSLLAKAGSIVSDPSAAIELRIACLPLLSRQPYEAVAPVLKTLLSGNQPTAISEAAFANLRRHGAAKTAPLLYEILPSANPAMRQEIITLLGNDPKTLTDLLQRMDRREVPKSLVDAESRWRFLQSKDVTVKALSEKLFERPAEDRAQVIRTYLPATRTKGNAKKGEVVFQQLCTACHSYRGQGTAVGPDISDVRSKDKAALLNDILDPNRMIEARWSPYRIRTSDGRDFAGLIESESTTTVVLRMPGGVSETLDRSRIASMESLDASLMPVGLEGGISVPQMADLLSFLLGEN